MTLDDASAGRFAALERSLGRMTNYVGVANFMGARLTAERSAFAPFLAELSRRGLMYLDDGSSSRSVARDAARDAGVPVHAETDVLIDAEPNAAAIAKRLDALERAARANGSAIGTASAFDTSVEAITPLDQGGGGARHPHRADLPRWRRTPRPAERGARLKRVNSGGRRPPYPCQGLEAPGPPLVCLSTRGRWPLVERQMKRWVRAFLPGRGPGRQPAGWYHARSDGPRLAARRRWAIWLMRRRVGRMRPVDRGVPDMTKPIDVEDLALPPLRRRDVVLNRPRPRLGRPAARRGEGRDGGRDRALADAAGGDRRGGGSA